jgi:hypothetical protein
MVFLAVTSAESHSRTWTVAQDGSGDFDSVGGACQAAVSGDSILIRPGLYEPEYVRLDNKTLSILGLGSTPDATRLKITFSVHSSNNMLFQNLCFFEAHYATLFAGGSAVIRSCNFRDCYSTNGVGVVGAGAARVLIEDCIFDGNSNTGCSGGCDGGAVNGTYTSILNCLFVDNLADGHGGAVYLGEGLGGSSIENCVFFRNTAKTGAAIEIYGQNLVTNCSILANRVTDPTGGAIRVWEQSGEISHLIVAGTIGGTAVDCWDGGTYR